MRSPASRRRSSYGPRNDTTSAACTRSKHLELTLEELVAIVRCIVPESEVAPTVCALFDRGIASFDRPPRADVRMERAQAG